MVPEHPGLSVGGGFLRPELGHPNGVQLGGIGTGRIELGRTGRITIAALTDTWQRLLSGMRGTFFALRTTTASGSVFRLLQEGGQAGYPGCQTVTYRGRHPVAEVAYADPALPVSVALTAFAPLVPHDLERSTIPGAMLVFRLVNPSAEAVEVDLAISWEHVLGCGGAGKDGSLATSRTGNRITPWIGASGGGLRCTTRTVAEGMPPNHVGECVLAADAPAGFSLHAFQNWNVLVDEAGVLAALAEGRPDPLFDAGLLTVLNAKQKQKQGAPPPSWDDPDTRFGGSRVGVEGRVHPAGVLIVRGRIAAGATVEIPCCLAWRVPHHRVRDQQVDHGRAAAHWPDAGAVAERLLSGWREDLAATRALADQLDRSDLPGWLADKLLNDLTPVTTNSILTASGELYTLEASPMMEGALGTLDQRLVSHPGWSLFWPELNRRELASFAKLQADDGSLSHFNGNAHLALGSSAVPYGVTRWPDLACSFIIQVYRDWRETGDETACTAMWPHVERAVGFLLAADLDGDGVPEGGSSWDIEHYPGCFVATASLFLATLRVLEDFAPRRGRADLLPAVRAIQAKAEATMQAMWTGSYYRKYLSTTGASDEVFIGQLEGEWAVQSLGLASILPRDQIITAAQTLYRVLGDGRYHLMPIQARADGSLPPRRYLWHAWPQYGMVFLDCTAIHHGLAEGLASVQRFDACVRERNRTPWATTLWFDARTGQPDFGFAGLDWYMNAPAVWFVLQALNGVSPDEPARSLTLGGAWPDEGTRRLPVVTPRWWGTLAQTGGDQRRAVLTIDRFHRGDRLELASVRWRGKTVPRLIAIDGRQITFTAGTLAGDQVQLTFTVPVQIRTGGNLALTW